MSLILGGIYKDGQIVLDHAPEGIKEARVEITFLDHAAESSRKRGFLKKGMYRKDGSRLSTWQDFLDAKKAWERED